MKLWQLFWILCAVVVLCGCTPETAETLPTLMATSPSAADPTTVLATAVALPTVTSAPLQPPSSPTPTAEPKIIVIGDTEKQQVQVGEIFIVQGSRGPNWQIGYDPEVLELLTTAEEQQTAGDTWLFMAIQATTQTVIRLDFSSPPCTAEPCPPPPSGAAILMEAFIEITQP